MQVHQPSSAAHVETMLRRHAYPAFGDRPIGTIRPSEIQAWVKGSPLAAATVHVLHGIVGAVFRAAIRDRIVVSSPCEQTKLPHKVKAMVVPLSVEAVAALAEAVPQRYRALVVLCAGTRLRQGEAFGLTQDRVNFLKRFLTVDRQLIGQDDGRARFGPPKTAASVRTVPVSEVVGEHLRLFGTGPDGLLFVDDDRLPLVRPRFSRHVWRPAVAAVAAVPTGPACMICGTSTPRCSK